MDFLSKLHSGYYSTNNYDYVAWSEANYDPAKMAQYKNYKQDEQRRHNEFKADAFAELGITGHPKAEALFAKAWEAGHSHGYSEVWGEMLNLVDLIL